MKKILTVFIAVLLMAVFMPTAALADSVSDGVVTIDGTFTAGTLETRVEALSGIDGPGDVIELYVTATGSFDAADIAYLNSMNNLEVLDVDISVTVGDVGDDFMRDIDSLKSAVFPATTYGTAAFHSCGALESVSLYNAVTLGDYLFGFCYELKNIDLPDATTFGERTFYYTEGLESITLMSAQTFGDAAFHNCDSLVYASLPSATTFGNTAFWSCDSLVFISTPSATSFGNTTFRSSKTPDKWRLGITPPTVSSFDSGIPAAGSKVSIPTSAITTYDNASAPSGDLLWRGWELVDAALNTAPTRTAGAAGTATVEAGSAYTLDISTIFSDIDGDTLMTEFSVDGGEARIASGDFSFTPKPAGVYTLVLRGFDGVFFVADTYTVTLTATNTAPNRKSGEDATYSDDMYLGNSYTRNLGDVFEDVNEDDLTYKVSINSASAVSADEDYSFTPSAVGTYTLVFTANDGLEDSNDTYTVSLTVEEEDEDEDEIENPDTGDSHNYLIFMIAAALLTAAVMFVFIRRRAIKR